MPIKGAGSPPDYPIPTSLPSRPLPRPPAQDLASKAVRVAKGEVRLADVVDRIRDHEMALLNALVGGQGGVGVWGCVCVACARACVRGTTGRV